MPNEHMAGREEKFVPADEAKLNESKRELLEKKLAQYEGRLTTFEKNIDYIAPEITQEFGRYYDNLAKMATTKILLENGSVSKDEVSAFVTNTAREHWEEIYKLDPAAVERVMKTHESTLQKEIKNGWGVICAYNEGRENVIRNSEPV